MHGKQIGFLGDLVADTSPVPVLIQTKKAWDWFKGNVVVEEVEFITAGATKHTLWSPTNGVTAERKVPRILLLPSSMVAFMTDEQRTNGQL